MYIYIYKNTLGPQLKEGEKLLRSIDTDEMNSYNWRRSFVPIFLRSLKGTVSPV